MTRTRKLITLIALALAASALGSTFAEAGWYDAWGYYHPTCIYDAFGFLRCF